MKSNHTKLSYIEQDFMGFIFRWPSSSLAIPPQQYTYNDDDYDDDDDGDGGDDNNDCYDKADGGFNLMVIRYADCVFLWYFCTDHVAPGEGCYPGIQSRWTFI